MANGRKTGGKDVKPGERLNPKGRPKLGLVDEAKHHAKAELIQAMCDCLEMTVEDLAELTLDPDTRASYAFVGSIIGVGIKKGCPTRATLIFNHILGKPPEYKPDDHDHSKQAVNLLSMFPSDVLAEAFKIVNARKAAGAIAG